MTCEQIRGAFHGYRTRALPQDRMTRIRTHLDACPPCWQAWNRHRWDAAAGTPLYQELVEYLGPAFRPYLDSSRTLATQWDQAAPTNEKQTHRFYRETTAYLYNQVIWHASGNRPPYVDAALPDLHAHAGSLILDYGCGIGEDLLALHHAGLPVVGYDLPSPPTDFLHWRAARHGYPHRVYQPDDLTTAPQPTVLWIIDVLDHLPDPEDDLGPLIDTADLAVTENITIDRSHGKQGFHHRRPLREIEAIFNRHGLHRSADLDSHNIHMLWSRQRRSRTLGFLSK